jgi:hypothetical protein
MSPRYTIFIVAKRAISLTLDATNLVWLQGRARACGARSVSELVDRLIAEARTRGSTRPATSVVGTIDIADSDPDLREADAAIRALFGSSLGRPLLVAETAVSYRSSKRRGRRG